ncbi:HsdM family class I SAM-dependent methyltransferase [Domibacillus mangrovi]|uniref:site-specific DNA-methyltransferase (adenine-specific) n=1 Tax=Domibacillus mangrovi TaxID=1714354 RepID=A0A1Q5P3E5_9BACI|nr:class I SAM-dependent DNA methyltransferase [Domibacillus mangrovi]OKL36693.1 DNA methyltransferase [Domibacillus mangrovi]
MITGEVKNKVDKIWEHFWTGGVTNPLTVIEQFTYLLFIQGLDDIQKRMEKQSLITGKPIERPIYTKEQENLRWSKFKEQDSEEMFRVVKDEVFPHMKKVGEDKSRFSKHLENAVFVIPTPLLLQRVITGIDNLLNDLPSQNRDTLGDLYEYLLSKLLTSGTNGQFRTPRHIIDMMVALMKPSPKDTIVDPASGTAGFLVSAAEYIYKHHHDEIFMSNDKKLRDHYNFTMFNGFDTDSTMLRIGAMNLMLHGIEDPNVSQLDSLSKTNIQEESYTLCLANPPFKGSLDYDEVNPNLLNKVKTKKTELLFLALMVRLLKTGGRCAVIVPDGVLSGASKAHADIRKDLVDNQKLEAVISMPSGVFKPYAGVSTAILIFTKTNNGGTGNVWFYNMQADGYSLDDKRTQLDHDKHEENNIPDIIKRFGNLEKEKNRKRTEQSFFVHIDEIRKNQYELSFNRFTETVYEEVKYEAPEKIITEIKQIETEIIQGMEELEVMLKWNKLN